MRNAFLVAILISIATPLIGHVIVLRRLSAMGDAMSHASLAGVAIGLAFGLNPVAGAVAATVAAGLSIEWIRRQFARYSEMANSIVMSLAVGLAAVFSSRAKSGNFNSFLFGSIAAVSKNELYTVLVLSVAVVAMFLHLYQPLFYIAFDEEGAAVSGVKVKQANLIFIILTAIVVSVSAKTVGALIISSLMVLPVACAMQVSHSYKSNLLYSIGFALFFTISGMTCSYYLDLRPGGTIVLIAVGTLFMIFACKAVLRTIQTKENMK